MKKDKYNLFQNLKMADNLIKMTIKSLTEMNISKDILKRVVEFKMKVKELEDIATESHKRTDNETENFENNEEEDANFPIKRNHHLVKCNLCNTKFKNVSNIEKHIKRNHTEYETYE